MHIDIEELRSFHCPRWQELPDIPLYMDQILLLLQQSLPSFGDGHEYAFTPAMVNNYVKHKIISPPDKKKYKRSHLAQLLVLGVLKHVLSMSEIKFLITRMAEEYGNEKAYDLFADSLEHFLQLLCQGGISQIKLPELDGTPLTAMQAALVALIAKLFVQHYITGPDSDKG